MDHVKRTRELNPGLIKSGGFKAVLVEAAATYKKQKKQKQAGGSGCPMGGSAESMTESAETVVGGVPSRMAGEGPEMELAELSDAHTMSGGRKKRTQKKSAKKSAKKGGKSAKKGAKKGAKKSKKNRKKGGRH